MLRMKAPFVSEAIVVFPCQSRSRPAPDLMLPSLQKADSLSSRNFSENQRAEHRHRVRRAAVKMSGGFSCGVKAWYRPMLAQHFRLFAGRETAKGIGDGPDQRVGEKRRLRDRPRPVRFRRPQFAGRR